jgi:UDP-glucuronate 4-epimerase
MALFKFVKSILNEECLEVFNNGNMGRDFTYIDDVVEALISVMNKPPFFEDNVGSSEIFDNSHYRILNIGNSKPVLLMDFISIIEKSLGKKAKIKLSNLQPGDVQFTYANMEKFNKLTGLNFQTPIEKGIENFVSWYKSYFKI